MTRHYPRFIHHGGASGVTGSCHRLIADADHALLVDCGLFQGEDQHADSLEQLKVTFDLSTVKALVITHVHIDHVGRLPYLIAAGFDGPILCSQPSARLLPLVIEDALQVGFTRDRRLIEQFLQRVDSQLVGIDYKTWHTVVDTGSLHLRIKLHRAGHILGSSFVEVALDYRDQPLADGQQREQRIIFSGDLGAPHAPCCPRRDPPGGRINWCWNPPTATACTSRAASAACC